MPHHLHNRDGYYSSDPWLSLIGLGKNSERLISFLNYYRINLSAGEIKVYNNQITLHNFYDKGISITFIKDAVNSIDFYQNHYKFQTVAIDMPLPFAITLDYSGEQFTAKFGTPNRQGGGHASEDVWFRYHHLQIDLNTTSWDRAHLSSWKAITIF